MENPADFKSRLMRQGKWLDFDRAVSDLVAAGLAQGAAYLQARREWGKEPADTVRRAAGSARAVAAKKAEAPAGAFSEGPAAGVVAGADRKRGSSYLADAEWVYQNIGNEFVDPKDAPSDGAVWLLEQARADPKVLREALLLMAKRSEVDATEDAIQRDCRRTREELLRTMGKIKHVVL